MLAPAAGLVLLLGAGAYRFAGHRDAGAGLLPQRLGPAEASASLRSPLALAWRLQGGNLIGWTVALAASGGVLAGAADGLTGQLTDNKNLTTVLSRLGGSKGLTDAFLAAVFGILGLVAAVYTVQAINRLRDEESSGLLEPLLATGVSRVRWAASHLLIALLGTAVLLAVAGLAGGLVYGAETHHLAAQTGRLLGAALVQLPAAWVFAGLCLALFGLAPRLSALNWATLVACMLLVELGALLGLNQWLVDLSPFAHLPKLPGSPVTATPMVTLVVIAGALAAAGLAAFRRRDVL